MRGAGQDESRFEDAAAPSEPLRAAERIVSLWYRAFRARLFHNNPTRIGWPS